MCQVLWEDGSSAAGGSWYPATVMEAPSAQAIRLPEWGGERLVLGYRSQKRGSVDVERLGWRECRWIECRVRGGLKRPAPAHPPLPSPTKRVKLVVQGSDVVAQPRPAPVVLKEPPVVTALRAENAALRTQNAQLIEELARLAAQGVQVRLPQM